MLENKLENIKQEYLDIDTEIPLIIFDKDDKTSEIIIKTCFVCRGSGKLRSLISGDIKICHVCKGAKKIKLYSNGKLKNNNKQIKN